MLAYILALFVGLGSFGLYMAAFFFPEVHRKNDFIWSGVGLFYALVLWVCAGRMTGAVLLGQIAVVSLLGWLTWQTLQLRRQVAPVDQQTPLPTTEDLKVAFSNLSSPEGRSQLSQQASRTFGQLKEGVHGAIAAAKQPQSVTRVTTHESYVPPKLEEFGTAGQEAVEQFAKVAIPEETPVSDVGEVVQEAMATAATNLKDAGTDAREAIATAATSASRSLTQAQPSASNPLATLPQQVTGWLKQMTETVRSRFQSGGQPPAELPTAVAPTAQTVQTVQTGESPPAEKQPYVRKKFREKTNDTPPNQPYVRQQTREAATSPSESKPVYVRKKFRQDTSEDAESKPVYVRQKFRQNETPDTASEAVPLDVADATVISVSEEINRAPDGSLVAEAVIEIESDTLAPDLIANAMIVTSTADPNATVEDIVEELLDDISVQEEAISSVHHDPSEDALIAIPPNPPSPQLVEAAIADAEEKGLPFDPPEVVEGE